MPQRAAVCSASAVGSLMRRAASHNRHSLRLPLLIQLQSHSMQTRPHNRISSTPNSAKFVDCVYALNGNGGSGGGLLRRRVCKLGGSGKMHNTGLAASVLL